MRTLWPYVLWLVALRLTALAQDPELERLALLVLLESLEEAHLSHKIASAQMGYSKAQWSDICAGRLHTPTHTRMLNLPMAFWVAYWPAFMRVIAKRHALDLVSDHLRMAKVVHPDQQKKDLAS